MRTLTLALLAALAGCTLGFSPGTLPGGLALRAAGIPSLGSAGRARVCARPPGLRPAWGAGTGPLRRCGGGAVRMAGEGKEQTLAELEAECEEAIVLAEKLWEEALASRQRADELCDEAGLIAERTLEQAETASQDLDQITKFSLKAITKSSRAINSSIDSMNAVALASEENERANELEKQAEEALLRSELLMEKLAELESDEEQE